MGKEKTMGKKQWFFLIHPLPLLPHFPCPFLTLTFENVERDWKHWIPWRCFFWGRLFCWSECQLAGARVIATDICSGPLELARQKAEEVLSAEEQSRNSANSSQNSVRSNGFAVITSVFAVGLRLGIPLGWWLFSFQGRWVAGGMFGWPTCRQWTKKQNNRHRTHAHTETHALTCVYDIVYSIFLHLLVVNCTS